MAFSELTNECGIDTEENDPW